MAILTKNKRRNRIHLRIRKTIVGTSTRPRLSVFRSNKEIYSQVIDDVNGKTIVSASSREKEILSFKKENKVLEEIIFQNEIGRIRDIQIQPITGKIFILTTKALWKMERSY